MAIRVLIVDDSSFFRRRISDLITAEGSGMEVAGTAVNGKEAVELAASLKPDVITMDVEMPIMDGIEAVKKIMASTPTPIIMFSSLTEEGAMATFNALEAGALDYITKNFDDIARNRDAAMEEIRAKIRDIASQGRRIRRTPSYSAPSSATSSTAPRSSSSLGRTLGTASATSALSSRSSTVASKSSSVLGSRTSSVLGSRSGTAAPLTSSQRTSSVLGSRSSLTSVLQNKTALAAEASQTASKTSAAGLPKTITGASYKPSGKRYKLLAIGSSTGGPAALQKVLEGLPANLPVPVIIVQHMPSTFTATFAARLDRSLKISVCEAKDGDVLQAGKVYIAPGGRQMMIEGSASCARVKLADVNSPTIHFKPCVDITFATVNNLYKSDVLAIILTGMGSDGANACKLLKQSGSKVWAQNEETCVIYGMPAAVVKAGAADAVVGLPDVAPCIVAEITGH